MAAIEEALKKGPVHILSGTGRAPSCSPRKSSSGCRFRIASHRRQADKLAGLSLPAPTISCPRSSGNRSAEDIRRQIDEERGSWVPRDGLSRRPARSSTASSGGALSPALRRSPSRTGDTGDRSIAVSRLSSWNAGPSRCAKERRLLACYDGSSIPPTGHRGTEPETHRSGDADSRSFHAAHAGRDSGGKLACPRRDTPFVTADSVFTRSPAAAPAARHRRDRAGSALQLPDPFQRLLHSLHRHDLDARYRVPWAFAWNQRAVKPSLAASSGAPGRAARGGLRRRVQSHKNNKFIR